MIDKFRSWLKGTREPSDAVPAHDLVQLSVAVLLVEIARADYEQKEVEFSEIRKQLARRFDLPDSAADELLSVAQERVEDSVSLHEFTSALHADLSYVEKETVIEMLWRIALADRDLDRYEDYMIGKIAELLYVYRGDVLRLKQRVLDSI
jgi:uncharacterized tellurite resistance protein B-like protein